MAYRGEDLDLRTPPSGRSTSSQSEYVANGSRGRATEGAIAVDDTVLACCNHAFDIAMAHGAAEVRLEHLVHALTRVSEAANILEDRGIRERHLRRESAAVIASEIPVGLAHSAGAPRASYEFENVLRRASQISGERGAAAGGEDLLWVLLNHDHDHKAIALLRRHAANWQSWDWPGRREVRVVDTPPPRREPPRRQQQTTPYAAPAAREEPLRAQSYQAERAFPAPAPAKVLERVVEVPRNDGVLERIDSLERSMHQLINLVRDLATDLHASRGMGQAVTVDVAPDAFIDQVRHIESAVDNRLGALERSITSLARGVGQAVTVDVAPQAFIDHVRQVESIFDSRLGALEKSVASLTSESSRSWTALAERLKSVDALAADTSRTTSLADLVTEQLVTLTEQVRGSVEKTARLEQLVVQRDGDAARLWSGAEERLKALDESLTERDHTLKASLDEVLRSDALQSHISERMQYLGSQLDQSRLELVGAMAKVIEPVAIKLRDVDAAADQRIGSLGQLVAGLQSGLQAAVAQQAETLSEASSSHQRDLAEVHEAILALSGSQKTLADNLEQWRLEASGDLGIISNRLELLEKADKGPVELLEEMHNDMAKLTQLALADYDQNRRSFKTWLFGTNEIFAGSWRDETAAIRARLSELKERRERRVRSKA